MSNTIGYVVYIFGGEEAYFVADKEKTMMEVYDYVSYHICDFLRDQLPLKVTDDIIRDMDIKIFEVVSEKEVEIPFQKFVDEYYDNIKYDEKRQEETEYKNFLKLYKKYKDRLPE